MTFVYLKAVVLLRYHIWNVAKRLMGNSSAFVKPGTRRIPRVPLVKSEVCQQSNIFILLDCKGGNFNIHIWVWFGYFICLGREIRFYL